MVEGNAMCSVCEEEIADIVCFCEFPLIALCSGHISKHNERKGFHFAVPVSFKPFVSRTDFKAYQSWLLSLSNAQKTLKENLKSIDVVTAEVERAFTSLQEQLDDIKNQHIAALRGFRHTVLEMIEAAVAETSSQALLSSPQFSSPLSEWVWWLASSSNTEELTLYRTTVRIADMDDVKEFVSVQAEKLSAVLPDFPIESFKSNNQALAIAGPLHAIGISPIVEALPPRVSLSAKPAKPEINRDEGVAKKVNLSPPAPRIPPAEEKPYQQPAVYRRPAKAKTNRDEGVAKKVDLSPPAPSKPPAKEKPDRCQQPVADQSQRRLDGLERKEKICAACGQNIIRNSSESLCSDCRANYRRTISVKANQCSVCTTIVASPDSMCGDCKASSSCWKCKQCGYEYNVNDTCLHCEYTRAGFMLADEPLKSSFPSKQCKVCSRELTREDRPYLCQGDCRCQRCAVEAFAGLDVTICSLCNGHLTVVLQARIKEVWHRCDVCGIALRLAEFIRTAPCAVCWRCVVLVNEKDLFRSKTKGTCRIHPAYVFDLDMDLYKLNRTRDKHTACCELASVQGTPFICGHPVCAPHREHLKFCRSCQTPTGQIGNVEEPRTLALSKW